MGANDSSEVSDLVGLFILHELGTYFTNIGGGLYRDDGLLPLNEENAWEREDLPQVDPTEGPAIKTYNK